MAPDNTRDGLTRALIGANLRDTSLLISSALSGEFNSITELDASNAEIKLLTNAQFEMNAKAIAAVKSGSALDSIPAIYAQPMDRVGLSDENHAFLTDHMETMQGAIAGILKKETRLMMYDAALAAAMGGEIPLDPVSGKPFQWDETTMTLSAPEGTPPLEPIILSAGN